MSALNHGFTTLLCVGEMGEDKEDGVSDEVLSIHLKRGLKGVESEQAKRLMVAYEPVWAIGVNGIPASKEYAAQRHLKMKEVLAEIFPKEIAEDIPVLYGGSVNPENAQGLIQMNGIDGLFIGRSAWDADNFYQIIKDTLETMKKA